jgi:hypothetical protein
VFDTGCVLNNKFNIRGPAFQETPGCLGTFGHTPDLLVPAVTESLMPLIVAFGVFRAHRHEHVMQLEQAHGIPIRVEHSLISDGGRAGDSVIFNRLRSSIFLFFSSAILIATFPISKPLIESEILSACPQAALKISVSANQ